MDISHTTEQLPSLVRFSCQDDEDDATAKKSNRRLGRKESKGRTKFMMEGVRQELCDLQRENEILRMLVREYIAPMEVAERILAEAEAPPVDIYLRSSVLMDEAERFTPQSAKGERSQENQHSKVIGNTKGEKDPIAHESISPEIPRVLSVPVPATLARKECTNTKSQRSPNTFHIDAVESLAGALSGDFAF